MAGHIDRTATVFQRRTEELAPGTAGWQLLVLVRGAFPNCASDRRGLLERTALPEKPAVRRPLTVQQKSLEFVVRAPTKQLFEQSGGNPRGHTSPFIDQHHR